MISTLLLTLCASVGALVLGFGSVFVACAIVRIVARGIGGIR